MKKNIIQSNGSVIPMSIEEVLVNYTKLGVQAAKKFRNSTSNPVTEDDIQEIQIAIWKSYESYDEKSCCFSTYVYNAVYTKFLNLYSVSKSKKHDSSQIKQVSMDYVNNEGDELSNTIADSTVLEDVIMEKDFIEYIQRNLTDYEIDLLAYNLGKYKASELGEKYGVTKSAITNKNARFKIKLEQIIKNYNK